MSASLHCCLILNELVELSSMSDDRIWQYVRCKNEAVCLMLELSCMSNARIKLYVDAKMNQYARC